VIKWGLFWYSIIAMSGLNPLGSKQQRMNAPSRPQRHGGLWSDKWHDTVL
jgi:hypothetical protein